MELIQTDFCERRHQNHLNIRGQEEETDIYHNTFTDEMTVRLQIPAYYAMDIFFKYAEYDGACKYLFYRGKFTDVL